MGPVGPVEPVGPVGPVGPVAPIKPELDPTQAPDEFITCVAPTVKPFLTTNGFVLAVAKVHSPLVDCCCYLLFSRIVSFQPI